MLGNRVQRTDHDRIELMHPDSGNDPRRDKVVHLLGGQWVVTRQHTKQRAHPAAQGQRTTMKIVVDQLADHAMPTDDLSHDIVGNQGLQHGDAVMDSVAGTTETVAGLVPQLSATATDEVQNTAIRFRHTDHRMPGSSRGALNDVQRQNTASAARISCLNRTQ